MSDQHSRAEASAVNKPHDSARSVASGNPHRVTEAQVREALAEIYTPEGVDIYYDAPNRLLNNATARQFVEAGDGERVLQIIDALNSGAYL